MPTTSSDLNMKCLNQIRHISVTVDLKHPEQLISTAYPILHCIRPNWDITDIDYQFFDQGLTNKVICFWSKYDRTRERILFRIYGFNTEYIIDRQNEKYCMNLLHSYGMASPIYCSFENGIAYGYANGTVLDYDAVRDKKIAVPIAKNMARLHSLKIDESTNCSAFDKNRTVLFSGLEKFTASVLPTFEDLTDQMRYDENFISICQMYSEISFLETHMQTIDSSVVFCHNDLLLRNIIHDHTHNSITFIDFEYAGFNYQSFDIANHFCEFAGTDNVDFTRYPNEDFQKFWISTYLKEYNRLNGLNDVAPSDVVKLYDQVQATSLAAHLFWALWAIVQAQNSTVDFDYLGYGIVRLAEYFRLKQIL